MISVELEHLELSLNDVTLVELEHMVLSLNGVMLLDPKILHTLEIKITCC